MVVHSVINSIEPPGSAEISQIAINLCGSEGHPGISKLLFTRGVNKIFASGIVSNLGVFTPQKTQLSITVAYGAICKISKTYHFVKNSLFDHFVKNSLLTILSKAPIK